MEGTAVIKGFLYSRGMHVSLLRLEGGGKLQASLSISSNSRWRAHEVTNLNGCLDFKRNSVVRRHTIWHRCTYTSSSSTETHTLQSRPLPHFHSHAAPSLKLRRSNPRNLFPCDWLLCCPQRGRGERENMSRESRFNMTKPVPSDPLFSTPDPDEPLLSPFPLDPLSPPFFISTSWPLKVHFSPLMQIALHIYDLLLPLLNMRLRMEGLECYQSRWISEYQ